MQAGYKVGFKRDARRELFHVPGRDLRRLLNRIRTLRKSPRPPGCKKLESTELYRVRQGDWRIVYAVADRVRTVTILKIGNRREVYR